MIRHATNAAWKLLRPRLLHSTCTRVAQHAPYPSLAGTPSFGGTTPFRVHDSNAASSLSFTGSTTSFVASFEAQGDSAYNTDELAHTTRFHSSLPLAPYSTFATAHARSISTSTQLQAASKQRAADTYDDDDWFTETVDVHEPSQRRSHVRKYVPSPFSHSRPRKQQHDEFDEYHSERHNHKRQRASALPSRSSTISKQQDSDDWFNDEIFAGNSPPARHQQRRASQSSSATDGDHWFDDAPLPPAKKQQRNTPSSRSPLFARDTHPWSYHSPLSPAPPAKAQRRAATPLRADAPPPSPPSPEEEQPEEFPTEFLSPLPTTKPPENLPPKTPKSNRKKPLTPRQAASAATKKAIEALHKQLEALPEAQKHWRLASAKAQADLTPEQVQALRERYGHRYKSGVRIPRVTPGRSALTAVLAKLLHQLWPRYEVVRVRLINTMAMDFDGLNKAAARMEQLTGGYAVWWEGRTVYMYRGAQYVPPALPAKPKEEGQQQEQAGQQVGAQQQRSRQRQPARRGSAGK